MKRYLNVLVKGWCLWIALALLAGGCGKTLQFRDIQDNYNTAVETEAQDKILIGEAGKSNQGVPVNTYKDYYQDVIRQLDKGFIGKLEEKLKPTAYVMLTASHIRLGQFPEARAAAKAGRELKETAGSPRDKVYLLAADGIILLESALKRFRGRDKGIPLTLDKYEDGNNQFLSYPDAFKKAYNTFSSVLTGNSDAPESMQAFLVFQKLRVLTHWDVVFSKITDKGERKQALYKGIMQKLDFTLIPGENTPEGKQCLRGVFIHLNCKNMDQAKTLDEEMARVISYKQKGSNIQMIFDRTGVYEFCSDKCFK
jgi:hypothetical protein